MNEADIDLGYGISVMATIGGVVLALLFAAALGWLSFTYMKWYQSHHNEEKWGVGSNLFWRMLFQKLEPDMSRGLRTGLLVHKLIWGSLLPLTVLVLFIGAIVMTMSH